MTATRVGAWSAGAVSILGLAYAVVLTVGVATHGLTQPIADPTLAVMEVLTLASALALLTLFAAIHAIAEPGRRFFGALALCFGAMFALATTAVHFSELTAGRQSGRMGLVWPSTTYAIELLAWDFLLGVALLLAAAAIRSEPSTWSVRRGLQWTGILCIAGLVGPAIGSMRMQRIGVFGYALVLPVAAWLMMRWLRAEDLGAHGPAARPPRRGRS